MRTLITMIGLMMILEGCSFKVEALYHGRTSLDNRDYSAEEAREKLSTKGY